MRTDRRRWSLGWSVPARSLATGRSGTGRSCADGYGARDCAVDDHALDSHGVGSNGVGCQGVDSYSVDEPGVDTAGVDSHAVDGSAVASDGLDSDDVPALPDWQTRREAVVSALAEREGPVTVDELADLVTRAGSCLARSTAAWSDAHETLVRRDLPALAAAGQVEYDAARGLVAAAGRLRVPPTAPVDPTAGATGLDDRHVALAVLGIAVLGVALGATVPALAPLSTLGPLVALLALVVFALHARR